MSRKTYGRTALAVCVAALLCWPAVAQAIELFGADGVRHVPQEKFIVFIFIGHSNVSSVNSAAADGWTHPRAWNYRWDSGTSAAWVPAKETAALGLTKRGRGGPAMILLKRLVELEQWKDYTFGIVQNAKPSSACQFQSPDPWHDTDYDRYKQGKGLHNEIVGLVKAIKGQATIAGIVAHLGWIETRVAGRDDYAIADLGPDLRASIDQIRKAVRLPKLPAYLLKVETESSDAEIFDTKIIQQGYAQVAKLDSETGRIAHIDVPLRPYPLSTAGDYMDTHHFGVRGHTKMMDQLLRQMQARGWGPPGTAQAPQITSHPASQTVAKGELVTLSVQASGYPFPHVQWLRDGVPIVAATAPSYSFIAMKDGARYAVRLHNSSGEVTSQTALIGVTRMHANHAPLAGADLVVGKVDAPIELPTKQLLANDVDPDANDTLHFAGVEARSEEGGLVGLFGTAVVYQPPPGFSGEDRFAYLVSDKLGVRSRGEVTLAIGVQERLELLAPKAGTLSGDEVAIRWSTTLSAVRIEWSDSGSAGPWKLLGNADDGQASWPAFSWALPVGPRSGVYLRLSGEGLSTIGGPYLIAAPPAVDAGPSQSDAGPPQGGGSGCAVGEAPALGWLSCLLLGLFFYRRLAR